MNEQHSQSGRQTSADPIAAQALDFAEQLQAQLDELQDQLQASNRLGQLGMLTAALAHETNNLITPIRSYAQLALANLEDQALIERALRTAVEGSQKVSALTERIVGLASPNQPIQTPVCDLNAVVDEVIQNMMPAIKQQGVHLVNKAEPISVQIDALSLEQVLINLISNACQAMREAPVARRGILIESKSCAEHAALLVRDTGPGVSDELKGRIFEPFVTSKQGADPQKDQTSGSGLGLSICKQIVEAATGQILLEENSDQGSTFRIELPLASAA